MAIGDTTYVGGVREQLLSGRARLTEVLGQDQSAQMVRLLAEVDSALERIHAGTFGICEECHTPVEAERVRENPLVRVCLDCLTPKQARALEYDLELAGEIQKGLLPPCDVGVTGWDVCYHYQPAGVVSGDYCDLIKGQNGELYFVMADVSGKGVAAAMLSSNLRAVFRSLIPMGLGTEELMSRANHLFRQSALPTQYATAVVGKAFPNGEMEIINAGHLPVLMGSSSGVSLFESTCQPLGIFDDQQFTAAKRKLEPGDTLVLYTDGISEAENDGGHEYGIERLRALVDQHCSGCPDNLIEACRRHLEEFRGSRQRFDDETLLAIQFTPAAGARAVV